MSKGIKDLAIHSGGRRGAIGSSFEGANLKRKQKASLGQVKIKDELKTSYDQAYVRMRTKNGTIFEHQPCSDSDDYLQDSSS